MKVRSIANFLSYFLLILLSLPTLTAQAQEPKKGSIFKFGKKEEGVSSGLFPDSKPAEKKWVPGKEGENMFIKPSNPAAKPAPKPKPAPVKTSPTVAKPIAANRKKGGFFSFGKKSTKSSADAVITPLPEKVRPQIQKPTTHSLSMSKKKPVAVPTQAGKPVGKEKSGGGVFSFFPGKKKKPSTESDLKAIANSTKYQGVKDTQASSVDQKKVSSKPVAPASQSTVLNPVTSADQFTAQTVTTVKDQTKKEKHKIGFPKLSMPSLPKIKMPGKKTDYTSVENVMKDGAFVEKTDSETTFSNASATTARPSGQRHPPTIVNGVKTYSSWDDVEGKSSSAADKILRQLR